MKWFSQTYPIAIDFDEQEVVALQLKATREPFEIRAGFSHPLPAGEQAGIAPRRVDLLPVLKKLRKARGFSGRRAVIHLPLDQTLCFPVEIRVPNGQGLEDAILQEAEKNIPYSLEKAVIDYSSIASTGAKHHQIATIVAAKRQDVMALVNTCKQAGFSIDAVDFSPVSLIRLHNFLDDSSKKPCIICHIGRRQSSLQVISRDRIYAFSRFLWGRDQLIEKLNRSLKFTDGSTNAVELLQAYGISDGPGHGTDEKIAGIVSRIITPDIEELVFEFHKILGYARTKEKFHDMGRICFYGFAATIKGLDVYFKRSFNIRAVHGDLSRCNTSAGGTFPLDANRAAQFCPVLGLAMRKIPWL
nr:pilus assembly protein PilM [uncultured Desulfobacter sp.]